MNHVIHHIVLAKLCKYVEIDTLPVHSICKHIIKPTRLDKIIRKNSEIIRYALIRN